MRLFWLLKMMIKKSLISILLRGFLGTLRGAGGPKIDYLKLLVFNPLNS
jgi:hypothetical protein